MTFWGNYLDHGLLGYGTNRAGKPDGLTDNAYIRREWQGGIELVAMMLEYHAHSRDAEFRDQTLLPFAAEIITFFDQHWPRGEDGKIRMNPSQALETWWNCTNPMPEVAGLRFVLPQLIELTHDAEQKAAWRKTLNDLPPIPIGEADGERFLLPAEKFASRQNMENPELYAVFPYRLYGVGKPDLAVALNTWPRRNHKGTGGWFQDAIHAARLGLTDQARHYVTSNFRGTSPGSRFPAMWAPNFNWMPDQDHGSVTLIALQMMLLQTDGDKIYLLPAWPKDWDVSFKLHSPQNTTIEGVYRNRKLEALKVNPESRRKDVVIGL